MFILCLYSLILILKTKSLLMQLTLWRRSHSTFVNVPIEKIHANSKHEFVEPGLEIVDVCGLSNGYTLLATNTNKVVVVDKLKVIKTYSGICQKITNILPLSGRAFVAITKSGTIDVYNSEEDPPDTVCGTSSHVQ